MRKLSMILCIILLCAVQISLFAGGKRETPTKHNVYATSGYPTFGAGYEGAIGDYFSLGAQAGFAVDTLGFELLLKPRVYFGSALEGFFIGANAGIVTLFVPLDEGDDDPYYPYDPYFSLNSTSVNDDKSSGNGVDLNIGANLGYKFVFGSRSAGFALEPFIGADYMLITGTPRFRAGLNLGVAWGGSGKAAAPRPSGDGIYVGIITFGPNAEDITGGYPILLDSSGLSRLKSLLNGYQRENSIGTALFYAAHMGLANMKRAESRIPRKLEKAVMVTFTDGLDVSSTGLGLAEISDPAGQSSRAFRAGEIAPYRDFISREIGKRTINGTKVEAYIAAVRGDDVTDEVGFNVARSSLASVGDKYLGNRDVDWNKLQDEFVKIANEIVPITETSSFTMITPQYAVGTRIRMTFSAEQNAAQAQNARLFIQGEVSVVGDDYYLTDISYGGISSDIPSGGRIKGRIVKGEVQYLFPGIKGFTFPASQAEQNRVLRQWQMARGGSALQINSEYTARDASSRSIDKKNAVIYLVLDKSSSINPNDVVRVREAAIGFLDTLYNKYNQR